MRDRLGFGLLALYLVGFLWAPSTQDQQNVIHDAIFYCGLLPWALVAGLGPGLRTLRQSRVLGLAVVLVLYLGASVAWSRGDLELPVSVAVLHTLATLGFLLSAAALLSPQRARWLCSALMLAGGLAALASLLAFAAGHRYPDRGGLHAAFNFEHPNLFAHALGVVALIGLERCLRGDRVRWAGACTSLAVLALVLTRGRAGLLGFLLGSALLLLHVRGRRAWLALGLVTLALGLGGLASDDSLRQFVDRGLAGRTEIYRQLAERVAGQPLFGLGLRARDDVTIAPGSGDFPAGFKLLHAHSAFVGTYVFGGMVGVLLLLLLLAAGFHRGYRLACAGTPLPLALLSFGACCLLVDGHRIVGRPHLTSFLLLWLPIVLVARATADEASEARLPIAQRRPWVAPPGILAAAALLLLAVRLPHLAGPVDEPHAWRQLNAVFVARSYAATGIDLLRPPVAWLGQPAVVVLDFPVPQAIWALGFQAFGERLLVARVVQLLGFGVALVALAALCRALSLCAAAAWAVWVAAAAPLALVYSRSLLPEQLALGCGLVAAVLGLRYLDTGGAGWALGSGAALTLAALLAPHWTLGWFVLLAASAWRAAPARGRRMAALLAGALAFALAYQAHAARANATAAYPFFVASHHPLAAPWASKLGLPGRVSDVQHVASSALDSLIGLPLLVPAAAGLLHALRGGGRVLALLVGHFLGLLLHLRAAVGHDYELLPLLVPLALLAGLGLSRLAAHGRAGAGLAATILLVTLAGNLRSAERQMADDQAGFRAVADVIRRDTPPDAVVAVSWGGLDARCPLVLVPAERRGFMVPDHGLSASVVARLQAAGASHLAVVTEGAPSAAQAAALAGRPVVPHALGSGRTLWLATLAR